MNRQMPTFEPFEPRLLMSGTPTLESLFASAELLDITPGMTVSADGQLATSDASMMYSFTAKATGTISLAMDASDGQLDPYLKLYDSYHRLLASNDNQGGSADSLISRYVSAGQTFYVEASGAGVSTGDFSLSLTSNPVDDFSNTMAAAKSVYVYATGSAAFSGTLNYSSDQDFVQYVAAETGRATVRLYSVSKDRSVTVFDLEGTAVDVQQSQDGYWLTATFLVTEGESSFIRISDLAGATGYFYAQVLPTIAQEFVDASVMDVPGAQQAAESGVIAAGQSDMYCFTAQATGYFEIDMSAGDGSSANPYLQVYNDQQRLYYTNDNARAGTLDSHIRMYVRDGQTFYVRASLAGGTDGAYDISFTGMPTDDLANSATAAAAMYSSATGAATKYGTVNYRGDVDVMSYSVRESGTVRANLGAYYGTLAGVVSVYDADGNVIASQTAQASGSVDLQFSAVAGEQYFFRIEGAGDSTGRYVLKVLPTVWQEFVDASAVNVPSASQQTVDGTLGASDRDTYKITVPATGYYVLDMKAADGSSVDSYLEVYNENQVRVAYNDNTGVGTGDSRVRVYVREGQVLYVRASAAKGSEGDYALTFESQPTDDAGNDAARAAALYVSPNGAFLKYGKIQYSDDVDCFAYTAKYSGLVQTTVAAYGYRSPLAANLTIRDAEGNEVGTAQAGAGGTLGLSFSAVQGQTYYFSICGDGAGLGMYNVKVLPTVWQDFIDATDVDVAGAATETVVGTLGTGGDSGIPDGNLGASGTLGVDGKATYKVTVPATGYMQVNMSVAEGSSIDSYLEVYNEAQRRVAYNDNAGRDTADSQVRIYVREGQVLYVRASATGGTEGDYTLTFESQPFDDAGNDAARAKAMYIAATGSSTKYGNVQYGNDTDCFAYTAKYSGLVQTTVAATGYRSVLSAVLTVSDAQGNVVGTAQAAEGGSLNLNFTAIEGQSYFFSVSGADSSQGRYSMKTLPTVWQDFIDATDVDVLGGESQSASGTLSADGRATYSFTVPASGYFEINMRAADGSQLDSYLEVYNSSQRRVAYSDNVSRSSTDSRVRIYVTAGQTYYVRASSAKGSEGDFALSFESQPFDDAGNDAARAKAMYVSANGSSTKYGNIQYSNDTDCFSYTAKASGLVQTTLAAYGYRSSLAGVLTVRDAEDNVVGTGQAAAGGAMDLSFTAVQGQTYSLSVSGADASLGMYSLKVLPTVWQDFIDATDVTIAAAGEQTASGTLAVGQYKTYAFTAPAGGYMQFDMSASQGSSIDSYIEVYTEGQRRLTYNDNVSSGTKDSRVRLAVAEGQEFYIRLSGAKGTAGDFAITFTSQPTDDFGNDRAAAAAMAMAASGSSTAVGTVNYGSDVDVFKFNAAVTGDMTVLMAKYGSSDLIGAVSAMDVAGTQLSADDASDGTAQITFHVVAGQTYYLSAASVEQTAGRYVLNVATQADPTPDPVAPSVEITGATTGVEGTAITFGSTVTDPAGANDLLTYTWSVTKGGVAYGSTGTGTSYTFTPDDNALYVVSLTVTDGDGGSTTDTHTVTVTAPDLAPGASVAGTVQQSGGTTRLVITGTNGNDVITLSYNGSATSLTSGAGTRTFAGYYGYISVYGFGGDDVIRLDYSIMGSTLVYAGDGNDKVYENSQGAATIYGGAGDDLLIAVGGGNDVIYGEAGADSYWVDSTDTLADSTAAEVSAKNVHRIASFYQPYSTNPASVDYVSKDINSQSLRDPTSSYGMSNYANRPLFVDGPQYDDIHQGALGDCYYLAVLASMSDTDPNLIRQAITDLGDGTYAVRFYRGGAEVYLRLDADMPSAYAKLTPDGETWVMLMEKAYAFFRYGSNSYSSIEGGWMSTVITELTGASSQTQWTGGSAASLASCISTSLAAGHSVTLGSYSNPVSPIVGGHAYMVKSIEGADADAYVTVYNPWGVDGMSYDSNYNDGLLRLSMAQIQACFSAVVLALV